MEEKREMLTKFLSEILKGREDVGDSGVDGNIILECGGLDGINLVWMGCNDGLL
jgi:hypothetical protein